MRPGKASVKYPTIALNSSGLAIRSSPNLFLQKSKVKVSMLEFSKQGVSASLKASEQSLILSSFALSERTKIFDVFFVVKFNPERESVSFQLGSRLRHDLRPKTLLSFKISLLKYIKYTPYLSRVLLICTDPILFKTSSYKSASLV